MSPLLRKAIVATSGAHFVVVIASLFVPLTAAVIAPALAIPVNLVGYYASLTFLVAALTSLAAARWTRKHGAIRVHQVMLVFAAFGLVVLVAKTAISFIISAVLIGLAYGPAHPASSVLLARHAPPRMRARAFALKQTAVPLGGIVAGILVPRLLTAFDWPGAALAIAGACAVGVVLLAVVRRQLDLPNEDSPNGGGSALAALREVQANVNLRRLGILAICYAAAQFSFYTVFAALLAERVKWSLTEAGSALSFALAVSIVSRLLWGWAADKISPHLVLAALGIMMASATISCAFLAPNWPTSVVYAVAVIFGASGSSWNALALSEAAHRASIGHVTEATAGITFCSYTGALLGPAIFSSLATISGTIAVPFLVLGIVAAIPVLLLLSRDNDTRANPYE